MGGASIIEQEAVSFIFKVVFSVLTGIAFLAYIFISFLSKRVEKNKKDISDTEKALTKEISDLKLSLAVNQERDTHIDKELSDIKRWMAKLDKKIEDFLKGK